MSNNTKKRTFIDQKEELKKQSKDMAKTFGEYDWPSVVKLSDIPVRVGYEPGENVPPELMILENYEKAMHTTAPITEKTLEVQQLVLFRFLNSMLREGDGAYERMTMLLDRFHQVPRVYSQLLLTRWIAELTPDRVPEWYFGLLWLLDKASDPLERGKIKTDVNIHQLLGKMPSDKLDFIVQYFAVVANK